MTLPKPLPPESCQLVHYRPFVTIWCIHAVHFTEHLNRGSGSRWKDRIDATVIEAVAIEVAAIHWKRLRSTAYYHRSVAQHQVHHQEDK